MILLTKINTHTRRFNDIQSPVQEKIPNLILRRATGTLLCIWLCLAGLFPMQAAAAILAVTNQDDEVVSWNLTADRLTTLGDSKVIEAKGRVDLRQGEDYLKADFIRYYQETQWVVLRGNVQAKLGKDLMEGEQAEFDLRSRVGWLKNGKIFIDGPHIYYTGERLNKHWGDTYTFRNARITTCDGDHPAWSISAQKATIELDGYSQLWHTNMEVKGAPVSYVPYLIVPAKTKRQTGFLIPTYGSTSQMGTWISQPFFWAIDESRDMTITETWFERRGFMTSLEYRSQPAVHKKSWLAADFLQDSQKHDKESDEPDNLDDDGLVRTNNERFWVRGMYDGYLGNPKWKVKLDADYVSDQNFLQEFKYGGTRFAETQSQLDEIFGRTLAEDDDPRKSRGLLTRDWQRTGISIYAEYNQDPQFGHGNLTSTNDTSLQTLPEITAYLFKGNAFGDNAAVPLEVEGTLQASHFTREMGATGSRVNMDAKFSLPLTNKYGGIIPTVSLQQTFYDTDRKEPLDSSEGDLSGTSRFIPAFTVDAYSDVARTYTVGDGPLAPTTENIGASKWTMLRHSVQPRVSYNYRPNVNQTDNPFYDADDRINALNEIRASLTNLLNRKRELVVATAGGEDTEQQDLSLATDYREFLRFRVETAYDLREATRDDQLDRYERRPVEDIEAELILSPEEYIALSSRVFYSPYEDKFVRQSHNVTLTWPEVGHLTTGYEFRERIDEYGQEETEELESLSQSATLTYFDPFTFRGIYRVDIEDGEDLEKTLEVTYAHQCFELIGRVSETPDDFAYQIMLKLPGFSF